MRPPVVHLDDAVVTALQRGVPLCERPFALLAEQLGTTEAIVIHRLQEMIDDGRARRFGAVFDARRLGYQSELCALRLPDQDLETVGRIVAANSGVTHCYQRGLLSDITGGPEYQATADLPNLWFTFAHSHETYRSAFDALSEAVEPHAIWRFPATHRFKIDVVFDPAMGRWPEGATLARPSGHESLVPTKTSISPFDKKLVRLLQGHIPIRARLFDAVGEWLGMTSSDVLDRLRLWQQDGILRRIGMVVRHRRLGFSANAMCVWPVDESQLGIAGEELANCSAVTHCYAREQHPEWPFSLYAMIHAARWDDTIALFKSISRDAQLEEGLMLGSLREYKKSSMRYFEP